MREFDRATAHKIQLDQKTVSMQGDHGDHFTVRLDTAVLRQIQTGEKFEIEINYSPDGKRKIALKRLPGSTPTARPGKEAPARSSKPRHSSTEPRTGYDWSAQTETRPPAKQGRVIHETARPAPPRQVIVTKQVIEAEAVGLDPIELERVKRERPPL